jgi:hypothetical protein
VAETWLAYSELAQALDTSIEALEARIATFKEFVAKAEALGEQHRQEAETAGKRIDIPTSSARK